MSNNRKHRNTFGGITFQTMALISAALLILSYLSILMNPAKAWFMTIFGLLFVPLVILNVLMLIWAVQRWSSSFFISLIVLAPSIVLLGNYYQFKGSDAPESEKGVKIVSYNVGLFVHHLDSTDFAGRRACADSVVTFLNGTDADIICLQEFYMPAVVSIRDYLKEKFPSYSSVYYMYANKMGRYGNVTLTRYPILSKGKLEFKSSSNLALYTDLQIDSTKLRIYNCHFESYNISLPAIAKSLGRDNKIVKQTEMKMKHSITLRPRQVEDVMHDIEECPVESMVVGDFNDNPLSYTYHRLSKGRNDSFIEAGKGIGATYRGLWPFLRIDYILYPDHYEALRHKVLKVKYSDHYPITSDIKI